MSSSNPFRRRQNARTGHTASSSTFGDHEVVQSESQFPTLDTKTAKATSNSKHVRIISPHSATSEDYEGRVSGRNAAALEKQYTTAEAGNFRRDSDTGILEEPNAVDPFGNADEIDDVTDTESTDGDVRRKASDSSPVPPTTFGIQRSSTLPGLATPKSAMSSRHDPTTTNKAPLDVDAFKRLLLTGDRNAAAINQANVLTASPFSSQNALGDSSSNTDASSLSRQSIFEPLAEVHQETPRTSHEFSPSDDERQRPAENDSPTSERYTPVSLQHRSTFPTKVPLPQTVPFGDPTFAVGGFTSQPHTPTSSSHPPLPRSLSDLNKPLPPPPASDVSDSSFVETNAIPSVFQLSGLDISASTTPPKKVPPPPPLSRRHSQLRSNFASPTSGTSNSIQEEEAAIPTVSPFGSASTPVTPKGPAPPPPPRRRGASGADKDKRKSTSDGPIVLSDLPANPNSDTASIRSHHSAKPPLPPSRTPSMTSVKRLSQRASPSNANPSSQHMAPPPPPPRRRGSSASSLASQRFSTTDQGALISKDQQVSNSARQQPPMSDSDVFADLSALQREVDALRGKLE